MQEIQKVDNDIVRLFFALVKCGIGTEDALPYAPDKDQWDKLFEIAGRQTLQGIAFAGIERLPHSQRPYKELLIKWYHLVQNIKKRNRQQTELSVKVSSKFREEGFANCILKGQGVARYYPDPELRLPGDIDIWLDGGDRKALEYVRRYFPQCKPTYHHVDFPIAPELDIEIHYRPSWMCNPFANRRLQKFFSNHAPQQFCNLNVTPYGTFPAPTLEFDRIYILLHIYRHLFFEGIGMRQILDYYYILQQPITTEEKARYITTLKRLKLYRFAGALMYVMQQVFGLSDGQSLVTPNVRRGKFLLREIMIAGNFGKYDHRYDLGPHKYSFKRAAETIRRDFTLVTRYPGETLWSVYFKVWHFFWRRRHC